MRMVAGARLRRAQDNILAIRPYARKLDEIMRDLAARSLDYRHPLLAVREPKRICLVVVTADRGLCGSFNANVIRATLAQLKNYQSEQNVAQSQISLICVGRKGRDFFRKRNHSIQAEFVNIFNNLNFEQAIEIGENLAHIYSEAVFDRIDVIYNEFTSTLRQRVMFETLLPLPPPEVVAGKHYYFDNRIYEPTREAVMDAILPKQLNIQLWRVLLESNAAEQAARMVAMENATTNAKEYISELTLLRNRLRQTAITKEVAEIVSGAEALK